MEEYSRQEVSHMIIRSRHMKIVDKDLNLEIKVSTYGFEEVIHEDNGQRFKSGNKGVNI